MTDTEKIAEITEPVQTAEPAESAEEIAEAATPADAAPVLFTEAELQARLAEARTLWDTEKQSEMDALSGEIVSLKQAAARRETEILCARMLRERSLDEEMVSLLLAPGDTEVAEEILLQRVTALSGAVEAAAIRTLREKTEGMHPGTGDAAPLTGKIIRETPIAKLSLMM